MAKLDLTTYHKIRKSKYGNFLFIRVARDVIVFNNDIKRFKTQAERAMRSHKTGGVNAIAIVNNDVLREGEKVRIERFGNKAWRDMSSAKKARIRNGDSI